ncbi:MAG: helix-turn-helix domain containing protein [Thermoleophilia bacterium]|nr:helix-turn-helix domain containing protein [Thermoleophilia bacterium]
MLVELGLVEQRHKAVLEVLDGASVSDVAMRNGVTRQTVHRWLRRYGSRGLAGLADESCRPAGCPHQMAVETEARVVELRRLHPGWGPRTLRHRLSQEGVEPLPGRSSIYRALVRHGLIDPQKRKRRREDYRRWERSRSMELWQMDIMGGLHVRPRPEMRQALSGLELRESELVDDHRSVGEVRVDLEAVEVADDQKWRVIESFPVLKELGVGRLQVLALAFVLPGEVSALPHIREALAAFDLPGPLLERVGVAGGIGLVRGGDAQHAA